MSRAAPLSYDRAAERIEEMMGLGTPFAQVEDEIDTAAAPQEDKAALWLLAWSLRDPAPRPRETRLRLSSVGTVEFKAP